MPIAFAKSTARSTESLIRNHLEPTLKKTKNVTEAVESWHIEGLAPNTILRLIVLYRQHCKDNRLSLEGVEKVVRSVNRHVKKGPKTFWTKEEAERALSTAFHINKRLYEVLLFALHTGARIGEVFGVRKRDLDFNKRLININLSYADPTKNGDNRIVPMSSDLEKILKNREDPIFEKFEVNRPLKRLCELEELPIITCHSLRRTFATILLDAGVSPPAVASLLGHANVKTTLNVYWQWHEFKNFGLLPKG